MKMIITPAIVILFIIAGAFAGQFLKSSTGKGGEVHPPSNGDVEKEKVDHGKKESHGAKDGHGKKTKKDKHGKSDHVSEKAKGQTTYYKFSREFVVPVMQDQRVKSLVILNINLEVDEDISSSLFSLEPKLRDNIMSTLIGLSNDGATLEDLTSVDSYETIRSVVLMNLGNVVSTGIENVLIVDVGKQDLL